MTNSAAHESIIEVSRLPAKVDRAYASPDPVHYFAAVSVAVRVPPRARLAFDLFGF